MARHECDECGSEVKNKNMAGHYRRFCCSCWIDKADADPEDARPFPGCECDECVTA